MEVNGSNFIAYLENQDREMRKNAFHSVYKTYGQYENTLASILQAEVNTNHFYAKAMGYPSALAASLETSEIPVSVYDNLVHIVNQRLDL
ncbi:M3 family metallopeptidase [Microaerobacter geothermalis]|uniref:M3 family metallopeptidase n=1 Tax=Microaerobacter geothermalis TaxID=674972 RepID=UPI001F1BBCDE|nr:M3 family metallopeptidase [Microaerobacter geothermalis]MCF6093292.1 M3 family metallopeptidase [Microaerobacter geothermalis]